MHCLSASAMYYTRYILANQGRCDFGANELNALTESMSSHLLIVVELEAT